MSSCIRGYVEQLPESYRAVLELGEIVGLKNGEIAAALGVSLGTVKIRLHPARARLKRMLEKGCSLYHDERDELACEPVGSPPQRARAQSREQETQVNNYAKPRT